MDNLSEILFEENFNIDKCLQQFHLMSDLQEIRDKLRKYGEDLKEKMSEILRNETEAIVNLAESLTTIHYKVNRLQEPTDQLREEMKLLYEAIKTAEDAFLADLEHLNLKNTYFHSVTLKMNLITSSRYLEGAVRVFEQNWPANIVLLERLVGRFSLEMNQLVQRDILTIEVQNYVVATQRRLLYLLNNSFVASHNMGRKNDVLRCLRLYLDMNAHLEAYETFQKRVVRPALQHIFALQAHGHNDYNLPAVYEKIIEYLQRDIAPLAQHLALESFTYFNFVLNSFWREYDIQSTSAFPLLGSPGNPYVFRQRFMDTYNLLEVIATESGNRELVNTNKRFLDYLARFNLPVYFEIIFQRIATKFESGLEKIRNPQDMYVRTHAIIPAKLMPTLHLYNCLREALAPNVFISHIADMFLRLHNLLMARYIKYIRSMCTNEYSEKFVIGVYYDLFLLRKKLCKYESPVQGTLYEIFPERFFPLISKLQKVMYHQLTNTIISLQKIVVKHLSDEVIPILANVSNIPRTYRLTNRDEPRNPSEYVQVSVIPFQRIMKDAVDPVYAELRAIVSEAIAVSSQKYCQMISDVLDSVTKTEEALRRFKHRGAQNQSPSAEPATTLTDEMKIRKQIHIDTRFFYNTLVPSCTNAARHVLADVLDFY